MVLLVYNVLLSNKKTTRKNVSISNLTLTLAFIIYCDSIQKNKNLKYDAEYQNQSLSPKRDGRLRAVWVATYLRNIFNWIKHSF